MWVATVRTDRSIEPMSQFCGGLNVLIESYGNSFWHPGTTGQEIRMLKVVGWRVMGIGDKLLVWVFWGQILSSVGEGWRESQKDEKEGLDGLLGAKIPSHVPIQLKYPTRPWKQQGYLASVVEGFSQKRTFENAHWRKAQQMQLSIPHSR